MANVQVDYTSDNSDSANYDDSACSEITNLENMETLMYNNEFEFNCKFCGSFLITGVYSVYGKGVVCANCLIKNNWKGKRLNFFNNVLPAFYCNNAEAGCEVIVLLPEELVTHLKDCKYRPVNCLSLGCSWQSKQDDLVEHFEETHQTDVINEATSFRINISQESFAVVKLLTKETHKCFLVIRREQNSNQTLCNAFRVDEDNTYTVRIIHRYNSLTGTSLAKSIETEQLDMIDKTWALNEINPMAFHNKDELFLTVEVEKSKTEEMMICSFPCSNAEAGCEVVELLPEELVTHWKDCKYRPVNCLSLGCSWQSKQDDLVEHFEETHQTDVINEATSFRINISQESFAVVKLLTKETHKCFLVIRREQNSNQTLCNAFRVDEDNTYTVRIIHRYNSLTGTSLAKSIETEQLDMIDKTWALNEINPMAFHNKDELFLTVEVEKSKTEEMMICSFPCSNAEAGCEVVELLPEELVTHSKDCKYRPVNCLSLGCSWQSKQDDLVEHFEETHQTDVINEATSFRINISQESFAVVKLLTKETHKCFLVIRREQNSNQTLCNAFRVDEDNTYTVRIIHRYDSLTGTSLAKSIETEQLDMIDKTWALNKINPMAFRDKDELFLTVEVENIRTEEMLSCSDCALTKSPIYRCAAGHRVCVVCSSEWTQCSVCRRQMDSEYRMSDFEAPTTDLYFSHAHQPSGCEARLSENQIDRHKPNCEHANHSREVPDCSCENSSETVFRQDVNVRQGRVFQGDEHDLQVSFDSTDVDSSRKKFAYTTHVYRRNGDIFELESELEQTFVEYSSSCDQIYTYRLTCTARCLSSHGCNYTIDVNLSRYTTQHGTLENITVFGKEHILIPGNNTTHVFDFDYKISSAFVFSRFLYLEVNISAETEICLYKSVSDLDFDMEYSG